MKERYPLNNLPSSFIPLSLYIFLYQPLLKPCSASRQAFTIMYSSKLSLAGLGLVLLISTAQACVQFQADYIQSGGTSGYILRLNVDLAPPRAMHLMKLEPEANNRQGELRSTIKSTLL